MAPTLAPHQLLTPVFLRDQQICRMVPESYIPTDEDKDFEPLAAAFTRPFPRVMTTAFDFILYQLQAEEVSGAVYLMFAYLRDCIGEDFAVRRQHRTSWVAGKTPFKVSNFSAVTFASSKEPILSFYVAENNVSDDEQGQVKDCDLLVAQAVSLWRLYPAAVNMECFVVGVRGQYLHISKASVSRDVMDTVWKTGNPMSEQTSVEVSREYDLMVPEDGKEVARSLLALFRYVQGRGEGSC